MEKPLIEPLEQRIAPATFVVTSAADSGANTLRAAIAAANGAAGADTITFNISGSQKIALLSALPAITDTLSILALPLAGTTPPQIDLDGSGAGVASGLVLNANGCKIEGLTIHGFSAYGIRITGNDNVISGNYIGLDAAGDHASANGVDGIYVSGNGNYIGYRAGDASANRISGNTGSGIHLALTASSNDIVGNFIGTDRTGAIAIGNGIGILLDGTASSNRIGTGTGSSLDANHVAGNTGIGIKIIADRTGNDVRGNELGYDLGALGNGGDGLYMTTSVGSTISNNSIVASSGRGIYIQGGSGNTVSDNRVGVIPSLTNATHGAFGNTGDGISIKDSPGNVIAGNLVGANGGHGIVISGVASDADKLSANEVGLSVFYGRNYANTGDGIRIDGAINTRIGSNDATDAAGANSIAANHGNGIHLTNGATGTIIDGNKIGFGYASGFVGAGNDMHGILIDAGAHHNTIGVRTANGNGANTIMRSGLDGIRIDGSTSNSNTIVANHIGTDPFGNGDDYGNLGNGISIVGAASTTVGGAIAGSGGASDGNGIFYSHGHGIFISGATATATSITGNVITNSALDGIHIDATASSLFDAAALASANTITGSGGMTVFDGTPGSVAISISGATVTEGDSGTVNAVFTVMLSAAASGAVTVSYATINGTATAGQDYTSTTGALNFAVGETSKTITVPVHGDTAVEGTETFTVRLTNSSGASISNNSATGTILDDDTAVTPPPVTVRADHRVATWVDVDGETVTLTATKAILDKSQFTFLASGSGQSLQLLDLSGLSSAANGVGLTFAAKKTLTGNGLVDVAAINATGLDLGAVKVSGDLGQIVAGDATLTTPGLTTLTLGSLGVHPGSATIGALDPTHSVITGPMTSLTTKGNVAGYLEVTGGPKTGLGTAVIGGNLDGAAGGSFAGYLSAGTAIGAVTIKGGIVGGANFTGIVSSGKLGKVTVLHNVEGTAAKQVTLSAFGKLGATTAADKLAFAGLSVTGNVVNTRVAAGFNLSTGAVDDPGAGIGPVIIGKNATNATVRATGALSTVTIGGDLDGSVGGVRAGLIEGGTGVGAVTVKGGILGGADFTGVLSGGKLGRVTVLHDIAGTAAKPVTIAALGKLGAATAADALAIAGIAVTGNVSNARILAGYDVALTAVNPDASIGAVTVGKDWSASVLAAGVKDTSVAGNLGSAPDGFGHHDTLIAGDTTPTIFASIAAITIKGAAGGSPSSFSDFFGITAQRLAKIVIGKTTTTFKIGISEDIGLDPLNGDFGGVDFS